MSHRPVTIKEVAARAGVSIMTVSKVMNDAPDISVGTKEKIRGLAREMGYRTNPIARGLRLKSTRTVGVLVPLLDEEHISEVVAAIESQLQGKGYGLLLSQSLGKPDIEIHALREMLDRRVDAIIICPAPRLAHLYDMFDHIKASGIPVVLIDRYPPVAHVLDIPYIVSDDRQGAFHAVSHLTELGHRRILFLSGPSGASSSEERKEGFRKAMMACGELNTDELIYSAGFDMVGGEKAALQVIQEKIHFTAIFAVNDLVAIGASEVLIRQGLRVPEDVSVVGYGDLSVGRYYRVPLTTVHQPTADLGVGAVRAVWELLEKIRPETRRLPVDLVIRRSSVAPGGK